MWLRRAHVTRIVAHSNEENIVIKRSVLVVVLLGALFGTVFGSKYLRTQQDMATRGKRMPAVVSTGLVVPESWQPSLAAVGSIAVVRGVIVSAELSGVIRKIHFDSGDRVSAGDLLVELDVDVDQAELAALRADRRLAEITRDRFAKISTQNLGSRSDLDQAQASLDRADAEIAAKEATIRKKAIRAPFAGELGIRRINPGQYLAPGDAISELVALDPIYAEFTLPERFLGELRLGQSVRVRVQSSPDRVFQGKLQAISPAVQIASRSILVRALLGNPDELLRPGMFAEVETLQPVRKNVLTLPERAVTYNTYGESVFVVEKSEGGATVRLVQIETGDTSNGRVAVKRGLKAGAEVVVDGHNKLRNGQRVTIDNSVDPEATVPVA